MGAGDKEQERGVDPRHYDHIGLCSRQSGEAEMLTTIESAVARLTRADIGPVWQTDDGLVQSANEPTVVVG
jgi:hypothetical protein